MKLYHGTEECLIDNEDINNFVSNFADNHLTFLSTSKEVALSYTMKNGIANLFEFDCNLSNAIEFDCKGMIWDSEELSEMFEEKTGVFASCPDDLKFLLSDYDAVIFKNISDIGNRQIKNYIGDTVMINSNRNIKFLGATNE